MKKVILKSIQMYQKYLSFDQGLLGRLFIPQNTQYKMCRFSPTCSQYSYKAIEKYGIMKGTVLSVKRIIRCNPFNQGGFDPVP